MPTSVLIKGDRHDGAQSLQRSDHLAALATQSLNAEAELTPKAGLVDRRGRGAHNDLSLKVMRQSATVLEPHFAAMAAYSEVHDLSKNLRPSSLKSGATRNARCTRSPKEPTPTKALSGFLAFLSPRQHEGTAKMRGRSRPSRAPLHDFPTGRSQN